MRTCTTDTYAISLHDALPIFHEFATTKPGLVGRWYGGVDAHFGPDAVAPDAHIFVAARVRDDEQVARRFHARPDRQSTRLNSSHPSISDAVFSLKKKHDSRRE